MVGIDNTMGIYSRFCTDFPERVLELLEWSKKQRSWKRFEVTQLLLASGGFLMTFENLRNSSKGLHLKDFEDDIDLDVVKKLSKKISDFFQPTLDRYEIEQVFQYAILKNRPESLSNINDANNFFESSEERKSCLKQLNLHHSTNSPILKDVLFLLRNAIAHSNLYFDVDVDREITKIWFATEKRDDKNFSQNTLKFLAFSPDTYYLFLTTVLKIFVQEPKLYSQLVDFPKPEYSST